MSVRRAALLSRGRLGALYDNGYARQSLARLGAAQRLCTTDAMVREICHIFRPFDGFQSARLVPSRDPERGPLCFAEFTNPELAFVALETLEGYLIDRDDPDSSALHIAFAKNKPSGRMARK